MTVPRSRRRSVRTVDRLLELKALSLQGFGVLAFDPWSQGQDDRAGRAQQQDGSPERQGAQPAGLEYRDLVGAGGCAASAVRSGADGGLPVGALADELGQVL